jgi:hypothetical protein
MRGRDFEADRASRWLRHHAYVTRDYVDEWLESSRGAFQIATPSAHLGLGVQGYARIDDVKIEPIEPEDLPDASAFLDAYRRRRGSAREGQVLAVPELQKHAAPGKQVLLYFKRLRAEGA